MRVSVVGCGSVSGNHLKALSETDSVEISSVVDIKKDRADRMAQLYGCKAYYDYETMLSEDKPDCVHICTPHYLHVDMSLKALERGIHVLCEKPCAISADGLEKLRIAQKKSNGMFGVCFQNRYNKSVLAVKEILEKGTYGRITAARAFVHWNRGKEYYSDDWHGTKEKEGGGVTVNQAIHTMDLLRYLIGADVKSVTAHVFNDHLKGIIEVEDSVHALLYYSDGTTALFNATTAFGENLPFFIDIVCEKAVLRIESNNAFIIADGSSTAVHTENNVGFIGKNYWGNGHIDLIRDFYRCIEKGIPFPIDADEGGKSVEEFLAIYESSESDKKIYLK